MFEYATSNDGTGPIPSMYKAKVGAPVMGREPKIRSGDIELAQLRSGVGDKITEIFDDDAISAALERVILNEIDEGLGGALMDGLKDVENNTAEPLPTRAGLVERVQSMVSGPPTSNGSTLDVQLPGGEVTMTKYMEDLTTMLIPKEGTVGEITGEKVAALLDVERLAALMLRESDLLNGVRNIGIDVDDKVRVALQAVNAIQPALHRVIKILAKMVGIAYDKVGPQVANTVARIARFYTDRVMTPLFNVASSLIVGVFDVALEQLINLIPVLGIDWNGAINGVVGRIFKKTKKSIKTSARKHGVAGHIREFYSSPHFEEVVSGKRNAFKTAYFSTEGRTPEQLAADRKLFIETERVVASRCVKRRPKKHTKGKTHGTQGKMRHTEGKIHGTSERTGGKGGSRVNGMPRKGHVRTKTIARGKACAVDPAGNSARVRHKASTGAMDDMLAYTGFVASLVNYAKAMQSREMLKTGEDLGDAIRNSSVFRNIGAADLDTYGSKTKDKAESELEQILMHKFRAAREDPLSSDDDDEWDYDDTEYYELPPPLPSDDSEDSDDDDEWTDAPPLPPRPSQSEVSEAISELLRGEPGASLGTAVSHIGIEQFAARLQREFRLPANPGHTLPSADTRGFEQLSWDHSDVDTLARALAVIAHANGGTATPEDAQLVASAINSGSWSAPAVRAAAARMVPDQTLVPRNNEDAGLIVDAIFGAIENNAPDEAGALDDAKTAITKATAASKTLLKNADTIQQSIVAGAGRDVMKALNDIGFTLSPTQEAAVKARVAEIGSDIASESADILEKTVAQYQKLFSQFGHSASDIFGRFRSIFNTAYSSATNTPEGSRLRAFMRGLSSGISRESEGVLASVGAFGGSYARAVSSQLGQLARLAGRAINSDFVADATKQITGAITDSVVSGVASSLRTQTRLPNESRMMSTSANPGVQRTSDDGATSISTQEQARRIYIYAILAGRRKYDLKIFMRRIFGPIYIFWSNYARDHPASKYSKLYVEMKQHLSAHTKQNISVYTGDADPLVYINGYIEKGAFPYELLDNVYLCPSRGSVGVNLGVARQGVKIYKDAVIKGVSMENEHSNSVVSSAINSLEVMRHLIRMVVTDGATEVYSGIVFGLSH